MTSAQTNAAGASVDFTGRLVMIGCGSIGQAVLPILRNHVHLAPGALTVLSAD